MSSADSEDFQVDSFGRQIQSRGDNYDGNIRHLEDRLIRSNERTERVERIERDVIHIGDITDRQSLPIDGNGYGQHNRPLERNAAPLRRTNLYGSPPAVDGGGPAGGGGHRIQKQKRYDDRDEYSSNPVLGAEGGKVRGYNPNNFTGGRHKISRFNGYDAPGDRDGRVDHRERPYHGHSSNYDTTGAADWDNTHPNANQQLTSVTTGRPSSRFNDVVGRGGGGRGGFQRRNSFHGGGDYDRDRGGGARGSGRGGGRGVELDGGYARPNSLSNRQTSSLPVPAPSSFSSLVPVHAVIPPLVTFKTFMSYETEDLSPEQFQTKYDEYNIKYIADFCDAFFNVSKNELWFQDRYNPLRFQELEQESCQWARAESTRMKDIFDRAVTSAAANGPGEVAVVSAAATIEANADTSSAIAESAQPNETLTKIISNMCLDQTCSINKRAPSLRAGKSKLSELVEADAIPAGKHFSGHEYRALFVTGIHASCSPAMFKAAVSEAFTASANASASTDLSTGSGSSSSIPTPERIVMAQPTWTKSVPSKFERKAWIIMPSIDSMQLVLKTFQESGLLINIPSPFDPPSATAAVATAIVGDSSAAAVAAAAKKNPPLLSFTVAITQHHIRYNTHILPEHLSTTHRLAVDTHKASVLAELLDAEKAIPAESRLSAILKSPALKHSCTRVSDKLDISIAYLRRVHFCIFYGGRIYQDEAQLLTMAPSCFLRHATPLPPPQPPSRPPLPVSSKFTKAAADLSTGTAVSTTSDTANVTNANAGDDTNTGADVAENKEDENDIVETSVDASAAAVITAADDENDEKGEDEPEHDEEEEVEYDNVGKIQYEQNVDFDYHDDDRGADEHEPVAADTEEVGPSTATVAITAVDDKTSVDAGVVSVSESTAVVVVAAAAAASAEDPSPSDLEELQQQSLALPSSSAPLPPPLPPVPAAQDKGQVKRKILSLFTEEPTEYVRKGRTDKNVELLIKTLEKKQMIRTQQQQLSAITDSSTDNGSGSTALVVAVAAAESSVMSKDEADAQTLRELNDKALTECVEVHSKREKDDKVRCWFPHCNKLFKNLDFLKKHVALKHEAFATEIVLKNAEPFMRARYEAEVIPRRPLPPIEYEAAGGRVERKSIMDLLYKYNLVAPPPPASASSNVGSNNSGIHNTNFPPFIPMPPPLPLAPRFTHGDMGQGLGGSLPQPPLPPYRAGRGDAHRRHSYNQQDAADSRSYNSHSTSFQQQRGGGGGRGAGGNFNYPARNRSKSMQSFDSTAASTSGDASAGGSGAVEAAASTGERSNVDSLFKRKLSTYLDVDAPKETAAAAKEIDYGVILPVVKKRKSVVINIS